MVKYKHNKAYYKLHFSELDEDVVQVYTFEGEESISRLFQYRFELISENPELNAVDVLDKKATFIITRGEDEPLKIHGVISYFEQKGRTPDYVSYLAVLVPKFWRTSLNYGSRIFQKMDIEKLVTEVLKENDFSSDDFEFSLHGSYPELEYCVQYRETDFNFLNRRLEHFGIYYYFDHKEDNDVIIFTDNITNLNSIESEDIIYNPNMDPFSEKESVTEIACKEKVVTGMFRLKDYNYIFPNKELVVENRIDTDAPGTYYDYGDHFKDESEGDVLVKIRNEEIYCSSKMFHGKSDCRLFRAGFKYKLGDHYRQDWNNKFLLTKIKSRGTQQWLFSILPASRKDIPTYENTFESILADREYRPPRITPIPRIPGIMTARMESDNDEEYAFIDNQGRYKLKLPFDLRDNKDGTASRSVRLSQPYTGPNYGIHFPNHADTEIVWACIDGNVDRPLGLGTVPNPLQSSPVNSENKMQNVIRTASGNELIMHDKIDEAFISVTTPDAHKLLMDDKNDKIEVSTTEKHVLAMNDKDKNITVQTKDGHMIIMDDKNTKITVQSKNGHRISINDSSGSENITLIDKDEKNKFIIDISNEKLVILTEDGSIDMHAPNGTIDIQATELKVETSGDTSINTANMTTEIEGDYDVKVGGNLTCEATGDLFQKGMNVTSEATSEHKSKGMNTIVEAGVKAEVKGTMVDAKASGINTIEGSLVKIN